MVHLGKVIDFLYIYNMTGKKQYLEVECSDCNSSYKKRKDSLKSWNGLCKKCSLKKVNSDPKMIEVRRNLGLSFIEKYGKIPSPKIENRRRGEDHHNWGKSITGENAYNWKGGVTPENERIRHSKEYKIWRLSVFERDKFTCVNCGDNKGGNLNADHIQPFSLYPELRLELDNGRTLCESCHKEVGWSPSKTIYNGTSWVAH